MDPMSSSTAPRDLALFTDTVPSDRPRIFVDGPGGSETKQGAKIACLECRSAKIKCSAPTDGQVPCKRCVKHQRECLFEKHKRGRKPNKRFSVPGNVLQSDDDFKSSSGFVNNYPSQQRPKSSDGNREARPLSLGPSRPTSSGSSQPQRNMGRDAFLAHDITGRYRAPQPAEVHGQSNEQPWLQAMPYGHQSTQRSATNVSDDRYHQLDRSERHSFSSATNGSSHVQKYSSSNPSSLTNSITAPSTLNQSASFGFIANQAHPISDRHHSHHHPPQPSQYPNRLGTDISSPSRWAEHVPVQTSSPGGGAHAGINSISSVPSPSGQHDSRQSNPYNHGRNRTFNPNVPAPLHSYAHWDSQIDRPYKNRQDGASPPYRLDGNHSSHGEGVDRDTHLGRASEQQHRNASQDRVTSPASGSINNGQSVSSPSARSLQADRHDPLSERPSLSRSRSWQKPASAPVTDTENRRGHEADEELEDEQDELEDDADATKIEHDYVLSNPLKLLAQASDAAAARIQGGRVEPGSRNSLAAVETMGLLHSNSASSRMAISTAINLTGLGRPVYPRHRPEDIIPPPRGWAATRTLPPLAHPSKINSPLDSTFDRAHRLQPFFLQNNMRSKSFPAGELPRSEPGYPPEDSDIRFTAHNDAQMSHTVSMETRSNIITPSTLDHEAWEYREGKAQARRGYGFAGAGLSPGGFSSDAVTMCSSTSSCTGSGSRATNLGALADGPKSPVDRIESPSDETTAAMLGKRKRSRSRLVRALSSSRRRRVNGMETDGELTGKENEEDETIDTNRTKQVTIATEATRKESGHISSGGESEAGASRKGYFNLSMFHSKSDDREGLDPVQLGLVELKEVEKLFDIFFARINPVLDLFDPFLHSVAYVRMRSAFLTTVITCMAARFSDTPRDAEIARILDRHWQEKLLPIILLDGCKSVEISQAFLILTTYCRPTNRLVDDRSWQYLGFAIRTATEVGVNRKVTPSDNWQDNEQVRRRVRNRERLWFNLFLYDRTLSAQTGRPWTISEDRMIVQSSMWHCQDFALPEDVSLVSLIKLRQIFAQHTEAFDTYLCSPDRLDGAQSAQSSIGMGSSDQSQLERRLTGLEFFRKNANADLEKWKETWCINTDEKIKKIDTGTAAGKYLVRWAPTAKLFYYHSRLIMNSLVLDSLEQFEEFMSSSSVSVDCWTSAISLIDTVLNDFAEESVVAWSNDRVVMAVYAAVAALRLTNMQHKYPFANKETGIALVKKLSELMTRVGKTPKHRNGGATPYGRYLKSILSGAVIPAQSLEKEGKSLSSGELDTQSTATTPSTSAAPIGTCYPGSYQKKGTNDYQKERNASNLRDMEMNDANSPDADADSNVDSEEVPTVLAPFKNVVSRVSFATSGTGEPGTNVISSAAVAAALDSTVVPSTNPVPKLSAEIQPTPQNASAVAAAVKLLGDVANGNDLVVNDVLMSQSEGSSTIEQAIKLEDPATQLAKELADVPIMIAASTSTLDAASTHTSISPALNADLTLAAIPNAKLASGGTRTMDGWTDLSSSSSNTTNTATATHPASATSSTIATAVLDPSNPMVANDATTSTLVSADALEATTSTVPTVTDDPESIEKLWDYMTAFAPHGLSGFWQPQNTWNLGSMVIPINPTSTLTAAQSHSMIGNLGHGKTLTTNNTAGSSSSSSNNNQATDPSAITTASAATATATVTNTATVSSLPLSHSTTGHPTIHHSHH